jgi:hypothetical protein
MGIRPERSRVWSRITLRRKVRNAYAATGRRELENERAPLVRSDQNIAAIA